MILKSIFRKLSAFDPEKWNSADEKDEKTRFNPWIVKNAPHINLIKKLNMRCIIGVKPDDHAYLFEFINAVKMQEKEERDSDGKIHRYCWHNGAPLMIQMQIAKLIF